MRPQHKVQVSRDGNWWFIEVPELPGVFTQARRLEQVEPTVREVISLMQRVPEDSFDLEIKVKLPPGLQLQIDEAMEVRQQLEDLERRSQELIRSVVAKLTKEAGLTVRDTGRLLGVSFQRIGQLTPSQASTRSRSRRRPPTPAATSKRRRTTSSGGTRKREEVSA